MFSKVNSIGLIGFKAEIVEVEVDLSQGLPRFEIVGLPNSSVSEAKERVRSAIKNCGLSFPISRITVNLAPADFRKDGSSYDLPILIGILLSSNQIDTRIKKALNSSVFLGEVSLNGEIRRVNGVLPMIIHAKECGMNSIFIPQENLKEAMLIQGIKIYPLNNISELIKHFSEESLIEPIIPTLSDFKRLISLAPERKYNIDFSDVIGQSAAKRALEIAASGGHNILMIGSPGSGKSMLAKRLITILPDMSYEEIIDITSIYSVAGELTSSQPIITHRPFRSPHHSVSMPALIGGGFKARPGEVSLAHTGVLFLDELPYFSSTGLESLRQPLEEGKITIVRNAYSATYPANIILVAAMNPCPCGYLLDPTKQCTCSDSQREKYLSKISGPLFDRMDIVIQLDTVNCDEIIKASQEQSTEGNSPSIETSLDIRKRVNNAREIQKERFKNFGITCNSQMSPKLIKLFCPLDNDSKELLISAYKRLGLSARAYDKIIRTARTIADLDGSESILKSHILEAIQYRTLDRTIK